MLRHRLIAGFIGLAAVLFAAVIAGCIVYGAEYYVLPLTERVDHPLHNLMRPGGPVGLLTGIGGTTLMLSLLLYSVRKSLLKIRFLGPMPLWLAFHIVCGVFGPLLIVVHSGLAWPEGLIAVGFWCMVLVALSGIFGRYVYGHFPKVASGQASDLKAAQGQLADLRAQLVAQTPGAAGASIGEAVVLARDLEYPGGSLVGLFRLDWEVRRRKRAIKGILAGASLAPTVRSAAAKTLFAQLHMTRSVETYHVAARWLRLWHLFHLPLAKAMYLIVAIHIAEALVFGGSIRVLREWWWG